MAQYNFTSPLAHFSDAISQELLKRELQKRQDLLDSLKVQQAQSEMAARTRGLDLQERNQNLLESSRKADDTRLDQDQAARLAAVQAPKPIQIGNIPAQFAEMPDDTSDMSGLRVKLDQGGSTWQENRAKETASLNQATQLKKMELENKNPVHITRRDPKTGRNVEQFVRPEDAIGMGQMDSPTPASIVINQGKNDQQDARVKKIANAIESGKMLLDPEGLTRSGDYGAVLGELVDRGADISKLKQDAIAMKTSTKNLNSGQQQRIRQDIDVIDKSLDKVDQLGDQWNSSLWGPFSRATLAQAAQGTLGQHAQSVAMQLTAQIEEVKARLASVYQNGGAPTQEAQKRADSQLANWLSAGTLHDMTKLARYNTGLQKASMDDTQPITPGGGSSNDSSVTHWGRDANGNPVRIK